MYEFVDSLTARGTTNYKGGLEKALALLQSHGKHGLKGISAGVLFTIYLCCMVVKQRNVNLSIN